MLAHSSAAGGGADAFGYEVISPELVLVDPELARHARRAHSSPTLNVRAAAPEPPAPAAWHHLAVVSTAVTLGCVVAMAAWLVVATSDAPNGPASGAVAAGPPSAPLAADAVQPLRFTWAAVPGAHSYRLVFYRGRTQIYEAVTNVPRRTLPLRWTFNGQTFRLTSGTYRWVVIPRLGPSAPFREGEPIVDASYTV
jgi:hypothetical protein